MEIQYSITVVDRVENTPTRFFLFQEKPRNGVTNHIIAATPIIEGALDGSTQVDFVASNSYYAIFGSSYQTEKSVAATLSYKKVALGPNGSVVAITRKKGYVNWDDESVVGQKCETPGAFEFLSDDTFIANDTSNLFVGIGVADADDTSVIIPAVTWMVRPSLRTQCFPKPIFYIGTSSDILQGDLVDAGNFGDLIKIDFTQAIRMHARLDYGSDHKFEDCHRICAENHVAISYS